MNLAFDMDGYELVVGDYVVCDKRLYRITKISFENKETVLELMHVKTTKISKRKGFEVERLN